MGNNSLGLTYYFKNVIAIELSISMLEQAESNSIHFAELNTVENVLDNLLKDGLIIISELWIYFFVIFCVPVVKCFIWYTL